MSGAWPDLAGRTAFVTGAGAGIGRAIALALAGEGVNVGLLTRSPERAEATRTAIEATGRRAVACVGDVGRAEDVEAAILAVVDALGPLDIVVPNAGIALTGTVAETSVDDWQRIVATNLSGVFYTCKYAVERMPPSGGAVVIIGSDGSVVGAQGYAAYVTTKHALVGLTKSMALDFGPAGVRTNIVCPTFVDTDMARDLAPAGSDAESRYIGQIPVGRFGRPQEIAEVVCQLASERSSFVNGLVYRIDGGSTAGRFHPDR